MTLGVESTSAAAATPCTLPLAYLPDRGVEYVFEYGPYFTTGIPFGSDPDDTTRTARTRQRTVEPADG